MLNPNIGSLSIKFQPKEVYNQTKARFICISIYLKKPYRIEYVYDTLSLFRGWEGELGKISNGNVICFSLLFFYVYRHILLSNWFLSLWYLVECCIYLILYMYLFTCLWHVQLCDYYWLHSKDDQIAER